jgi:hypothetical protein
MPCILFRTLDAQDPVVTTAIATSTWDVRLVDSMHG